jgi:hypothetical protein
MKKKLTFLILIFAGLLSTQAQMILSDNDDPREKMRLSIRAGLNFSSLYDSKGDDFSSEYRAGLIAGAFLSVPISKFLGFQPEVNYSQKGFNGSGNLLIARYEFKRKLDFLDIPLQLQIKPSPYFHLVAGPQFSFLLRKSIDFESGSLQVEQQSNIDTNIRRNTLGAVVGADVILMNFVISGRLAWDLQHNNGDGTSTSPRYKLMVGQITAGIIF